MKSIYYSDKLPVAEMLEFSALKEKKTSFHINAFLNKRPRSLGINYYKFAN